MHDGLRQRHAAAHVKDAFILGIALKAEPRFDRNRQRGALADVAQEGFQPIEVPQKAGPPALGNNCPRRATQVKIDLAIAHVGKQLRGPHELIGTIGEELRMTFKPSFAAGSISLRPLPTNGQPRCGGARKGM